MAPETAQPMVGGALPASGVAIHSTVTILGPTGNVCSGALIAPTIVLTAAHCVRSGATYRIFDSRMVPAQLVATIQTLTHPLYNAQAMEAHRATADIALMRLSRPVSEKTPASIAVPRIERGVSFSVAGGGVTTAKSDAGIGIIRMAQLSVTGKPGTLQIRLVDPLTLNARAGLGACTGDSGGPAFQTHGGRLVIVGVIAWSTGPNSGDGCGGLTGVTPLTLYLDWINRTVRLWDKGL